MSERILIGPIGGGAVFETGVVSVSAKKSRDMDNGGTPVKWNASGSITQVWLAPDSAGTVFQPGFLIDIYARRTSGEARVMVVARAIIEPPKPSSGYGSAPKAGLATKDLMESFDDRSIIFANLEEGWFPIRSDPAVFHLDIVGGTEKFEEATGRLTCTFRGLRFGNFGLLMVEEGTIAGEIFR